MGRAKSERKRASMKPRVCGSNAWPGDLRTDPTMAGTAGVRQAWSAQRRSRVGEWTSGTLARDDVAIIAYFAVALTY